jgi:hypothetical protein
VIVARGTAVLAVAFILAGCGSSPASVPSASPSTAESIAPRWNLIEQNLNDCGGVQPGAQRDMCGAVVWQDYLLYKQSGLDEAFSTTVLAYQWALGLGIDKTWLDGYVTKLVQG